MVLVLANSFRLSKDHKLEWIDVKPNTNQNIDPHGSFENWHNDMKLLTKTTKPE